MGDYKKTMVIIVGGRDHGKTALAHALHVEQLMTIEDLALKQIERTIEEVGKLQAELLELCNERLFIDRPLYPAGYPGHGGFIGGNWRPRMKRISSSKQRPRNWYAHRKTRRKLRKQSLKINRRKC